MDSAYAKTKPRYIFFANLRIFLSDAIILHTVWIFLPQTNAQANEYKDCRKENCRSTAMRYSVSAILPDILFLMVALAGFWKQIRDFYGCDEIRNGTIIENSGERKVKVAFLLNKI